MSNVTPRIRVNVLAYNEEDFIELCLESINEAVSSHGCLEAEVNIICNGCRDNTYHVAKRYCENRNGWHVFDVEFGDKANAWNFAIEEGNKDPILTVFVDGDCTITPDSIRSLLNSYLEQPNCYIIAGLPKTKGRTTDATRSKTIEGEALSGNFYALTPSFLKKVYQLNFRLPVGLIGDIRSADGSNLITEKTEIFGRWEEHYHVLLNRSNPTNSSFLNNLPDLPVIQDLNNIPS